VSSTAKQTLRGFGVLLACALVLPASAGAASRAAAATPCWKLLMNEWYSGRIVHIYPIPCYRQAIQHLPTDVQVYSSAREDIQHALALAIAHQKNPTSPAPTLTVAGAVVHGTTTTVASATGVPGNKPPPGPIPTAIANSSPGGATSFPLPLIILGGLAIVLLAAGGIGLLIRRSQGRGGSGTA
jgi:hypothetical protein